MHEKVSNFENLPSKAFTDFRCKKTLIRLDDTSLSAVGGGVNFNAKRFMKTSLPDLVIIRTIHLKHSGLILHHKEEIVGV